MSSLEDEPISTIKEPLPLPPFTPDPALSEDENLLTFVSILARHSMSKKGHMGTIFVRPPEIGSPSVADDMCLPELSTRITAYANNTPTIYNKNPKAVPEIHAEALAICRSAARGLLVASGIKRCVFKKGIQIGEGQGDGVLVAAEVYGIEMVGTLDECNKHKQAGDKVAEAEAKRRERALDDVRDGRLREFWASQGEDAIKTRGRVSRWWEDWFERFRAAEKIVHARWGIKGGTAKSRAKNGVHSGSVILEESEEQTATSTVPRKRPNEEAMEFSKSNSIVWHTSYDVDNPPPKPSAKHVRFIVVSDTHNTEPEVPFGDVLLHSGDLTVMGSTKSFQDQLRWLDSLPHQYKYVIAGNHDFGLCTRDNWLATRGKELHEMYKCKDDTDPEAIKKAVKDFESNPSRVHRYLEDEKAEFRLHGKSWSVYGSPWTPEFESWAWNYKRGAEAKEIYSSLPQTDILLTHGPPHKIGKLDVLTDGVTHVGCEELADKVNSGEIRPTLFCFGHIHEARGTHLETWQDKHGSGASETLCINAALVEYDKESPLLDEAPR
ncbi:hypothetical protein CBS101457_006708 [Exobasidium rhododendri]|nr:hypothetical protein CBS101457_006708 [Exobasidium rhododendri]